MSAFAMRGAGTKSDFMHDKSPVINFLFRFNRLSISTRLASFSRTVSLDDDNADSNLVSLESEKSFRDNDVNYETKCISKFEVFIQEINEF